MKTAFKLQTENCKLKTNGINGNKQKEDESEKIESRCSLYQRETLSERQGRYLQLQHSPENNRKAEINSKTIVASLDIILLEVRLQKVN
jgi:hypothetical protein